MDRLLWNRQSQNAANFCKMINQINKISVIIPTIRRNRSQWSETQILGDELRIARETIGYTQLQLATILHTNRTTIGRIECGKQEISVSLLAQWAKATGRTVISFQEILEQEKLIVI